MRVGTLLRRGFLGCTFVGLSGAVACSGSSGATAAAGGSPGLNSGGGNAGLGAATSGAHGGATTSGKTGAGGLLIDVDSATPAGGVAGGGDDDTCAAEVHGAQRVPVDIHVMLDISGSMLDPTASGVTKWDATRQALADFVESPASAGLGVGIQYFPLLSADVPSQCTSSADCGNFGPCVLKTCTNSLPSVVACDTDADCGAGSCIPLGSCPNSRELCVDIGIDFPCGFDLFNLFDQCEPLTRSTCDRANCDPMSYREAAVPIAPLPKNSAILVRSIDRQSPAGGTPTSLALAGALDYAKNYAESNAGHTVAVVFATDGLPTDCGSTDIADISDIAASAFAASPSIRTYVVGVFGPEDEEAPANLDAIARAGGTDRAFMVDTSQNVTASLTEALDSIRGATLACEFRIPPSSGASLDFNKVNVAVTDAATTDLFYVRDVDDCDPKSGGWYYNTDPKDGTSPTQISLCPATCDALSAAPDASVEIRLGCQTVVQPPK